MRIRGAEGGTRKRNGAPKEELDRGNGAPKEELERGMRIRGTEGGTQKRNENSRPPTEELKKFLLRILAGLHMLNWPTFCMRSRVNEWGAKVKLYYRAERSASDRVF